VRIGLVLNRRGLDRALRAGVDEINFVCAVSEAFAARNQGSTVAGLLQSWVEVAAIARHEKIRTTATITTVFGCPFEGEIDPARVDHLVARIAEAQPDEIALADTIGVAAPSNVARAFTGAAKAAPGIQLRAHFHNTRNTGIANAYAAMLNGVTVLDASLGGIGGCPFAPAATGNIPTEDLTYMLQRMGHVAQLDVAAMIQAAAWLPERLGHAVPALLGRAGVFP
jgi:hydroxymethylglutaryl-CoA lyase